MNVVSCKALTAGLLLLPASGASPRTDDWTGPGIIRLITGRGAGATPYGNVVTAGFMTPDFGGFSTARHADIEAVFDSSKWS